MVLWRRQVGDKRGHWEASQEAKSRVIWVKVVAEAKTLVVFIYFFLI